jgi:hypothetical protein
MGLLSRLGRGMRGLGSSMDQGAARLDDLSPTTPPDIEARIRDFQAKKMGDLRMGRGMGVPDQASQQFFMKKETLASQVEQQSPQAAQMIRAARDEMELENIMGRLQNPASFGQGAGVPQQGADFGMRPPQDQWGR